jgi:hypothetical protein
VGFYRLKLHIGANEVDFIGRRKGNVENQITRNC